MKALWNRIKAAFGPNKEKDALEFERELCAFLPGALEVQARPPSPLPRMMVGIILLMFTLLIIWATVAKVDIIATAEGKIIPTGRTKEINALQQSRVTAIHVTEGQRVEKGDVLIELDQSLTGADLSKTQTRLTFLKQQVAGYAYLKERIQQVRVQPPKQPVLPKVEHTNQVEQQPEQNNPAEQPEHDNQVTPSSLPDAWVLQTWQGFSSQWKGLEASLSNKLAEARLTQTQIKKLETTLPIIQERARNHQQLQGKKLVARTEFLELEQQRITSEFELEEARAQLAIVNASLEELQAQQHKLLAETQALYQQQYLELMQELESTEEEHHKADALNNAQTLTAPVSGTIMQLSVTTLGSVVQPATPLMLVVPEEALLEAEVLVQNKDIGFIDPKMDATVKIHTFTFTKFGTIDGIVTQVSGDAVEQEQQGLLFPVKVQLKKDFMQAGDRKVKLKPGMSVTTEIKIGKRRVIEFFLAPLLRAKQEAVRER